MKSTVNEPLVSIIIPFLNAAQFIMATIESVIAQSYKNWEVILVDDGSSDGSFDLVTSLTLLYPKKIRLYHHQKRVNKGAAASRNFAVSKSSGELITFLDSDDLWLPRKLEMQVEIMKSNSEIDVLCEATKYWNSWFDPKAKDVIILIGAPQNILYNPPKLAAILYPLGFGDSFCTCALMLKRKSFLQVGGFDEAFTGANQLFEDQTFFLKICLTQKVYLSSICNNIYRQRPNSLMHGIIADGHYDNALHFFLVWLKNYIEKNSIKDAEIDTLITKALLPYKYPILYKIKGFIYHAKIKIKRGVVKISKKFK